MQLSSFKAKQTSQSKSTSQDNMQSSPKDGAFYMPSFTGISSNSTFQQTNNHIKTTERAHIRSSQSMQSMQQLSLINDEIQYVFDFTDSSLEFEDIFDIFEDLTKQQQFQMIERQQNYSTAIKQKKGSSLMSKLNLSDLFLGCFPFLKDRNNLSNALIPGGSVTVTANSPTAIKIVLSNIINDSEKQKRIGRIRGLSGLLRQVRTFILKFKQKISHYLPQSSRQWSNYFVYDTQHQTEQVTKKSIEHSDPYHLQISTFYVIEKILSNSQYQIGEITHRLIQDYRQSFKNFEESIGLIPEPIRNATKIVNQIYYWFNNNSTLKNTKKNGKNDKKQDVNKAQDNLKQISLHQAMTPFVRISIQQFIFKKLSHPISEIYHLKNVESEQIFIAKRNKIFQKYSTKQILQETSLNVKFWAVDQSKLQQLDHIHSRKQTRSILKMSEHCCSELEKITLTTNPRQKVKHMQLAYTSLKTFFYDYSKQKYELSSMEDIIPVLILMTLLLNIEDFRRHLDIMGDFIQCDPYEMQSQKRLYINLSQSYNYVLRDWKV